MKTITRMRKLMLSALLIAGLSATGYAQTTMYSTNWNDSFEGWSVVNDVADSPTWDYRGTSDGIQASNTQDAASEEWIVSPEFDFSDGSTFTLIFNRAFADSENGQLDVYYTENWGADGSEATWTLMDEDITNGLSEGWNGGANYVEYNKAIPSTSATVRISFKYTSTGFTITDNGTPEDTSDDVAVNNNRIRVKDLIITTSGSISSWQLPYSAAWALDLEDWTVVDNKYTSKTWAFRATGTANITDSKRENDDWLISPTIICNGDKKKEVSLKAGWDDAKSSNISLYYSTDYAGDVSAATWIPIAEDIIPSDHIFGFAGSKLYSASYQIDLNASKVHFAIHYAPFEAAIDVQNEIRVKGFNVEEVTSTAILDNKIQSVKVFPNPTTSVLNLDVDGEAVVKIYNIAGQEVKTEMIRTGLVNVAELHPGQYIIRVSQDDIVYINRFIKK